MIDNSRAEILTDVCRKISAGDIDAAEKIIEAQFPFSRYLKDDSKFSEAVQLKIFRRDGFVDRFSGKQVILPPVLDIISKELPDAFPYQRNWAYDSCHQAYYILRATLAKISPSVSSANEFNLVTTSYVTKTGKANANLDDLGCRLLSLKEIDGERWDGLTAWFTDYVESHEYLLGTAMIAGWYTAIKNS